MGQTLIRALLDGVVPNLILTGAHERADSPSIGMDAGVYAGKRNVGVAITADLPQAIRDSEVIIDFTFHTASAGFAPIFAAGKAAWVIGTTGFFGDELKTIRQTAAKIPVLLAPNMSLGVNLLAKLVEEAARALAQRGYDCEIIERHQRHKKDAPSGTALFFGEAAARGFCQNLEKAAIHGRHGLVGERRPEEIGFHAIRGGDIVGDHTVMFAAAGETLEFSHRATSRDTFAFGALRAAQWIAGRAPGLYGMSDVLGLSD
jgi:4-hydroxy-tetrahydrodipicolinate reductase